MELGATEREIHNGILHNIHAQLSACLQISQLVDMCIVYRLFLLDLTVYELQLYIHADVEEKLAVLAIELGGTAEIGVIYFIEFFVLRGSLHS